MAKKTTKEYEATKKDMMRDRGSKEGSVSDKRADKAAVKPNKGKK